jgi:hypothetical protein
MTYITKMQLRMLLPHLMPLLLGTLASEHGIHVHVYEGEGHRRLVDDTFGEVILNGWVLDRRQLWQFMTENTRY